MTSQIGLNIPVSGEALITRAMAGCWAGDMCLHRQDANKPSPSVHINTQPHVSRWLPTVPGINIFVFGLVAAGSGYIKTVLKRGVKTGRERPKNTPPNPAKIIQRSQQSLCFSFGSLCAAKRARFLAAERETWVTRWLLVFAVALSQGFTLHNDTI